MKIYKQNIPLTDHDSCWLAPALVKVSITEENFRQIEKQIINTVKAGTNTFEVHGFSLSLDQVKDFRDYDENDDPNEIDIDALNQHEARCDTYCFEYSYGTIGVKIDFKYTDGCFESDYGISFETLQKFFNCDDKNKSKETLEDEEKIQAIREYMETLIHTRWKQCELEKHLQEKFGLTSTLDEVDEDGCVSDYAFLMGIFDGYGYIDIYFLRVPYDEKDVFITEVNISKE